MVRVLKTVDEEHYVTLSTADKLALVRDQLRGKESDHFRISNLPEDGGPGRVAALAEQVVRLREKEAELAKQVEAEEEAEEAEQSDDGS